MNIQCLICHKNYKHPVSLRRHIRTHDARTRRYTCPECLSHFGRLDNFNRHTATKHPGKTIQPVLFNPRSIAKTPVVDRVWEVTGIKKSQNRNKSGCTTRIWQEKSDHSHSKIDKTPTVIKPIDEWASHLSSSSNDTICMDEPLQIDSEMEDINHKIRAQLTIITGLLRRYKIVNQMREDLILSDTESD